MRIMITGARAPVALELARALGRAGHWVAAADTTRLTLTGASRYVARRVVLPPPRYRPLAFARALAEAVEEHGIELVVPTCEEVFYVSWACNELLNRRDAETQSRSSHLFDSAPLRLCGEKMASAFCAPLGALRELHSKAALVQRAAALGIATPRTVVVEDDGTLRAALPLFPSYVLKPAFSRFATRIITNRGPRASQRSLSDCRPTPQHPWLVQEYVEGAPLCSYTLLHNGHPTAHCAYTTPSTVGGGAGTSFVSAEGWPTLEIARALGRGFTGQLSLDFIREPGGRLALLECNPRATSGAHLLAPQQLVGALLDPQQPTWVEPAGKRRQLALAALPQIRRAPDVIFARDDPLPALAQFASVLRFGARSLRKRIGLLEATTDEIEWNGDDLPALAH